MEEKVETSQHSPKTFEETMHGFGHWIARNLAGIFAVLISMFFIFSGVVKVLPTELALKEQIIMVFINIVAGWSITSLIAEYGFTSAKNSSVFQLEKREYNQAVKNALKHREPIEALAKERAKENLHTIRVEILESVNIDYAEVFNEDGSLNTNFDITKYKNEPFKSYNLKCRAYRKAVRLRVQSINVFGQASSSMFGLKKEVTEKEYRTKTGAKKFIVKVLLSVATVGIMFEFIGWSVGAIIYAFMQVCLWCGMGLLDRQKNYNFIMDTIMPRMVDYKNIILEFESFPREEQEKYINYVKEKHHVIEKEETTGVKMIPMIAGGGKQ